MSEAELVAPAPLLDPQAASLQSEVADMVQQAKNAQDEESKQEDATQVLQAQVGRHMRHKRTGDVVLVTDVVSPEDVGVVSISGMKQYRAKAVELQMEFLAGSWVNVSSKTLHRVQEMTVTGVRPALVLNSVRNNARGHFNTLQARHLGKNGVSVCEALVSRWNLLKTQGENTDFVKFIDATTMMRPEGMVKSVPREQWASMHPTWAPTFVIGSGVELPPVRPGLRSLGVVLSKPWFGDNSLWLQCVRLTTLCGTERVQELCDGAWKPTDLEVFMLPITHARLRSMAMVEAGQWKAPGFLCPHPEHNVLQSQDLTHLFSDQFCMDHFEKRLDDPRFKGFVVHAGCHVAVPLMGDGFCDEALPDLGAKVNMLPYFSTEATRAFFEKHPYLSLQPVEAGAWSVCSMPVADQEPVRRSHKRRRVASRSVPVEVEVELDTTCEQ